jgi:DNA repair photolyase
VLRRELGRPRWSFEMVALGTVTDCYQPAEGRYRLTRACLEALCDAANPIGLVTKSTLVLRDLDVLATLARHAKVRVFFTVTTLDLSLWRSLEPGTASPYKRLEVMRTLVRAGVPAGVLLAPILPGITDSAASIEAVAAAADAYDAAFFGTSALRLRPAVRPAFYEFVAGEFPSLLPRYERAYLGANAPAEYLTALDERVAKIRAAYGFAGNTLRTRYLAPERAGHTVLAEADRPRRVGPQLALPL